MSARRTPSPRRALDAAAGVVDIRAFARRAVLPVGVLLAAAAVLVAAHRPLEALADALHRALDADPRWVVGAAVLELLAFSGYIALMWLVGARESGRLGLRASAEVTLGGAAATRMLPTGGAGGAAVAIWTFRRAGLGARDATRTLLTFLVLLYSVFLAGVVTAGAAVALGFVDGHGPVALAAVPAALAGVAIAGALALAGRGPAMRGAETPASGTAYAAASTLADAVRDAVALVRSPDVRLLGAIAWWTFDGAVLLGMLHALGAPPSLAVVALAYFIGQIAGTIPIPGAVSGGTVGILLAFGVETDLALASVLAYRAVAVAVPVPLGLAALGGLRRTVAGWAHADTPAAEAGLPGRGRPSVGWHGTAPAAAVQPA